MSLRAMLDRWTRRGWTSRFEVDDDGWWYTHNGQRMQRTRWRPKDEVDVLIAVQLLYMLNETGAMPLPPEHLDRARQVGMDEERFRLLLMREAYKLFIHLRSGRDVRTARR
ncbi:hypothetical protein ACGFI3_42825 [Nonomuraea wenchangensis]|uniref:hypothetical protein n=1 Tax=Nonomuraea wenchangensis TaxID=568860 RepID=UPI00371FA2E1